MTTPETTSAPSASAEDRATNEAASATPTRPTPGLPRWIWPFLAALLAIGVHFLLSVPRGPMEYVKPEAAPPPTSNDDDDELPRVPQRPTAK